MQSLYTTYFFTLLLCLSTGLGSAQKKLVYEEDFSEESASWVNDDNEKRSAYTKGGYYRMAHKQETKSWLFFHEAYVNTFNDFIVETALRLDSGAETSAYGLIWGVLNSDNSNGFMLSGSGYFKVYKYEKGVYTSIQPWKKHSAILPKNNFNKIKIHRDGNMLYYYVNDQLVYESPMQKMHGGKFGFKLEHQMEVTADYLRVYQDGSEINLVPDAEQGRKKQNLGTAINTVFGEIMPVVSADNKTLYFTRKDHPDNLGEDKRDDVWVAHKNKDGIWEPAQNIGAPINNTSHNHIIALTPDGNTALVGNRYKPDGSLAGRGLSLSRRTASGWSVPQEIEIDSFYNRATQHSYSLSANTQVLVMSLERDDTYGEKDLYVSFKLSDRRYSQPMSLGPEINSFLDETTPFLASDGRTLYFSSEGYPGYGSADIFVSKRLDDTWKKWSKPQNLGPEINSSKWDAYYTIPASGEVAYLVSQEGSIGRTDIFVVEQPKAARPDPVVLVKGHVYSAQSKKPLSADIDYQELETERLMGKAVSNPKDGAFQVVLNYGHIYGIGATREGYYPIAEKVDLIKLAAYTEMEINLYMHPISLNEVIPLKNIFIEKGKLLKESNPELDRLAQLLDVYKNMKIELGADSEAKANLIRNYLLQQGIAANRVTINSKKTTIDFKISSLGEREILAQDKGDFRSDINVNELEVGHTFRLDKLYFSADLATISPNSERVLSELYEFLHRYPQVKIEVGGHTNGLPAHEYCDKLSKERAENVRDFLLKKGLPASQVEFKGYGKRRPIADNTTEFGRRQNQRVEIKVLEVKK